MIVLINGGPSLDRFGPTGLLGRLVGPRGGPMVRPGEVWAGDNDAFNCWDEGRFRRMLGRFTGVPDCLFVAAPDVVGDARATLIRFDEWRPEIVAAGFPVALVGQDGAESLDQPWQDFAALFVGGSTEWKLSRAAADLAAEAKRRGKWIHLGRVNTKQRLRAAWHIGADSIDGSGWSKFPDHYMRRHFPLVRKLSREHRLFA